jgi:acetyl-CoA acetyltransferase
LPSYERDEADGGLIEEVVIAGAATVPGERKPASGTTTEGLLARAFELALENAGLGVKDVDGLGIASFGLRPDRALDLAWKLGLSLRWLMDDVVGLNLVQHAAHAVQAGDASVVVVAGGDYLVGEDFGDLAANFNRTVRDYLSPLPTGGPNALFSFVTQAHMAAFGLGREAYGQVAVAQRAWASRNPAAIYRTPLSMEEYLQAPMVADPLCLYDCVPPAAGAEAVVITSAQDRLRRDRSLRLRSIGTSFNHDHQEGDGLSTGLRDMAARLWDDSGLSPAEIDVVSAYDDYPVMVLVQLEDLGFIQNGDAAELLTGPGKGRPAVNTSGGMLSAGQAGAGGGLHGLVECVRQLRGERGDGQVAGARTAMACCSTTALYRYGGCAAATVLDRGRSW